MKIFFKLSIALSLLISTMSFANVCMDHLEDHISENHAWLLLNNCNITPQHFPAIKSFMLAKRIKGLNLENNHLNDEDINLFAQAFSGFDFDFIELASNKITDIGAITLINTIPNPFYLGLNNNFIGDDGMKEIAKKGQIFDLALNNNNISDGAAEIANNTRLYTLELENNHIGPRGAMGIAKNSSITFLYLSNNNIGDAGLSAFGKNNTVLYFYANKNNISGESITPFSQNSSIHTLTLNENSIGNKGAQTLGKKSYQHLELDGNRIGDEGAAAIAPASSYYLSLNHNRIGDKGAIALAQKSNLLRLYVNHNCIGRLGLNALASIADRLDDLEMKNQSVCLPDPSGPMN